MTQIASGVRIFIDAANDIRLVGVDIADLDPGDFIF